MCIDLKEPNKAVIVDSFPLPHMDKLLSALKGSIIFTTVDLTNTYYQVLLHKDNRDLTAFINHDGLFCFYRVPCGLASMSVAFQKMMIILEGVPRGWNLPGRYHHSWTWHAMIHMIKHYKLSYSDWKPPTCS